MSETAKTSWKDKNGLIQLIKVIVLGLKFLQWNSNAKYVLAIVKEAVYAH